MKKNNRTNVIVLLVMIVAASGVYYLNSTAHADSTIITTQMSDTTNTYGLKTDSARPIMSELVTSSSSLVGKSIDTMTVSLRKGGSAIGTVQVGIFNSDLSVKQLFGTIDASTLTTSYISHTFSLTAPQSYQIQSGDRIGIKFTGGSSSNFVAIMTDQSDTYDGTKSYLSYYYNSAWFSFTGVDLTMALTLHTSIIATPPPDTTPPVITLLGSNPVSVQLGSTYVDSGVTATDPDNGDLTSSIIVSNPVNTAVVGTYTVTYNVKDPAGNAATQVTRTVNVVNTSPSTTPTSNCQNSPIVAVSAIGSDGNVPQNAIDGNLATRWSNLGVGSWIKLDLGNQQTVCSVDIAWYLGDQRSNNFVISTSVDGNTFTSVFSGTSSGTTASFENYSFTQTDARYVMITVNGNTQNNWASISEINVKTLPSPTPPVTQTDTTPPVITLLGSNPVSVQLGSTYVDSGATATDPDNGDLTSSIIVSNPVNTAVVGTYTVTYNVKDPAGNAATQVTRTVNVVNTSPSTTPPSADKFGIQEIYSTISGGREWFASWSGHGAYTISSGDFDPHDSQFQARGNGYTHVNGDGTAYMSGSAPRMYVIDPTFQKLWNNVEITFYGKRVSDSSIISYQGLTSGIGGSHDDVTYPNVCNDFNSQTVLGTALPNTAYNGRILYDGRVDYEKEVLYHRGDATSYGSGTYPTIKPAFQNLSTPVYSSSGYNSMPFNTWIGYKFIVRDTSTGVHLETWMDMTGGLNGGTWVKMNSFNDNGGWSVFYWYSNYSASNWPCPNVPLDYVMKHAMPYVHIRADSVNEVDYKDFSVREINPLS